MTMTITSKAFATPTPEEQHAAAKELAIKEMEERAKPKPQEPPKPPEKKPKKEA